MVTAAELRARSRPWPKGRHFEDFEEGQSFAHHWGRTLLASDSVLFSALTMHFNPRYFNFSNYQAGPDVERRPINPILVFLTVFGLSVEDLSEAGGAFLGVGSLTFHRQLYAGDSVRAKSIVIDKRESRSQPTMGIVTWHTEGHDQANRLVVDFNRTNMITRKGARR